MAGYPTAFIGKWHMGNDDTLPPLGPATGTPDADVRGRLEMLLAVDESLGRIVETLEALGKLEHTVVILTSDHGCFYGEHGLNEETAGIPMIIRYPSVATPGSTPSEMVQTIDLASTIVALTGARDSVAWQGRSLLPVLAGNAPGWRTTLLTDYCSDTGFPRALDGVPGGAHCAVEGRSTSITPHCPAWMRSMTWRPIHSRCRT
ncbi:MAG: sulfatase-like hydrolase/transferase [Gemmatimonadales bacterium]|nr:sulfatase-like hydrolase/transferase [Gemmatimonadales bacterium]